MGKADYLDIEYENDEEVAVFYYDNEPVLKLKCENFEWRIPKPKKYSGRTVRLASVTFTENGRRYDYICDIEDVKASDNVIVIGYDGETEVVVHDIYDIPEEELALPLDKYKKVERKA